MFIKLTFGYPFFKYLFLRGYLMRNIKLDFTINNQKLIVHDLHEQALPIHLPKAVINLDKLDSDKFDIFLRIPNSGSQSIAIFYNNNLCLKQCTRCNKFKPSECFSLSNSNSDNLLSICKACKSTKGHLTTYIPLEIEQTQEKILLINTQRNVKYLFNNIFNTPSPNLSAQKIINTKKGIEVIVIYNNLNEVVAKDCNKCKKLLLISQFAKNKRGYGNTRPTCKTCMQKETRVTKSINLKVIKTFNNLFIEHELGTEILKLNILRHSLKAKYTAELKCYSNLQLIIVYKNGNIAFKQCSDCKLIKPLYNFHTRKRGIAGKTNLCSSCRNTTNNKRKAPTITVNSGGNIRTFKHCSQCNTIKLMNKFRLKKDSINYHTICKSCESAYHKKYRIKNQDLVKIRKMKCYYLRKDYYQKKSNESYNLNPEPKKEYGRLYYRKNQKYVIKRNWLWRQNNRDKDRINKKNYVARKIGLLDTFTSQDSKEVASYFNNSCCLTGNPNPHWDHFVCLATGHMGTFKGNYIPMSSSLNESKRSTNPFIWIKRFPHLKDNFDSLIRYLAAENNLSIKDYEDFVYWCYDNPRTIEDIKNDPRSSIDIWQNQLNNP